MINELMDLKIGVLCTKFFGKKRPKNYKENENLRFVDKEAHKRFVKYLFDLK